MIVWSVLPNSPLSVSWCVAFRFGRSGDSRREYFLKGDFWRATRCPGKPPSRTAAIWFSCAPFGHCVAFGPSSCDTHAMFDHPRRLRHLSHDPTPTNSAVLQMKPTIRAVRLTPSVSVGRGGADGGAAGCGGGGGASGGGHDGGNGSHLGGSGNGGGGREVNSGGRKGGSEGGVGYGGGDGSGDGGGGGGATGDDGDSGPSGVQPRNVSRASRVRLVSASVRSEYWIRWDCWSKTMPSTLLCTCHRRVQKHEQRSGRLRDIVAASACMATV